MMSEVSRRYIRAKIKNHLSIFEKIEEYRKKFFEENPNTNDVEITLTNPKTGEEMRIVLTRD